MTVLACTGSRPSGLYGYDGGMYGALLGSIGSAMAELRGGYGFDRVVTGGAQGADMLCFAAMGRLNRTVWSDDPVKGVVMVPFPGQERGWGEDGPFGAAGYRRMIGLADRVDTICREPSREAYMARNRAMVDVAAVVLAVSMKDPAGARTGTGGTVRYAMGRGLDVFWLHADDGAMTMMGGRGGNGRRR